MFNKINFKNLILNMNKHQLVDILHSKLGGARKSANLAVETILDSITNSLKNGEEVSLSGFGTFRVSKRAARTGVNPRTGEKIQIPAMKVPKFKAGKKLKDAVR